VKFSVNIDSKHALEVNMIFFPMLEITCNDGVPRLFMLMGSIRRSVLKFRLGLVILLSFVLGTLSLG
jgi:hypothetical protein